MTTRNFEPVKLGVIGLGRFGRLHALTAARLAEADLVALVARRQDKAWAISLVILSAGAIIPLRFT